ncbi:MAG: ferredoxin [Bacilli bacterium]|nr:ferredoxin [Bacilli bacterium]
MAVKVSINPEACIGCGLCISLAPDAIAFGDDGKAQAIGEMDEATADDVVASCPAGAISR